MFLIPYNKDSFINANQIIALYRDCYARLSVRTQGGTFVVDSAYEDEFLDFLYYVNMSDANLGLPEED